jgi:hypothetical protein
MRDIARRIERIESAIRAKRKKAASDKDILGCLAALEHARLPRDDPRTQARIERLQRILDSAVGTREVA